MCSLLLRFSTEDPEENNLCLKFVPASPDEDVAEDFDVCGGGGGGFILACSKNEDEVDIGGGGGEAGTFGALAFGKGGADVGGGEGAASGAGGGEGAAGTLRDADIELPCRLCLIEEAISLRKELPLSAESLGVGEDANGDGADGMDGDGADGICGVEGEIAEGIRDETLLWEAEVFDGAIGGTGGADAAGSGGAAAVGADGDPVWC